MITETENNKDSTSRTPCTRETRYCRGCVVNNRLHCWAKRKGNNPQGNVGTYKCGRCRSSKRIVLPFTESINLLSVFILEPAVHANFAQPPGKVAIQRF